MASENIVYKIQLDDSEMQNILISMRDSVVECLGSINESIKNSNMGFDDMSSSLNNLASGFVVFDKVAPIIQNLGLTLFESMKMTDLISSSVLALGGSYMATVVAIGTVIACLSSLMGHQSEESILHQKNVEAVNAEVESFNNLKVKQEEQIQGNLSQVDATQRLSDELHTLVDANGKVKDGYTDRVAFIISALNSALGTEMTLTDGVIQGYDELSGTIDDLIVKKRAKIILDAEEEMYGEALKNRAGALTLLSQCESEYMQTKTENDEKLKVLQSDLDDAITRGNERDQQTAIAKISLLEAETESKAINYENQKQVVAGYNQAITQYEADATAIASGDVEAMEEINNRRSASYVLNGEIVTLTLDQQMQNELANIATLQEQKQNAIDTMSGAELEYYLNGYNSQLADSENRLAAMTTSNGTELSHYDTFMAEKITKADQLRTDLQNNVKGVTEDSVIEAERQKAQSLATYAGYVDQKIMKASDLRKRFENNEKGITEDMVIEAENQAQKASTEFGNVAEKVTDSWDDLEPETRAAFQNMVNPMVTEMEYKKDDIFGKASEIAVGVLGRLKKAFDIHSPSRKTKDIFKNVMLGAEKGIDDEIDNLQSKADSIADTVLDTMDDFGALDLMHINDQIQEAFDAQQMKFSAQAELNANFEIGKALAQLKLENRPIQASFRGTIENHLDIEGREAAITLTPFIVEEMAFQS